MDGWFVHLEDFDKLKEEQDAVQDILAGMGVFGDDKRVGPAPKVLQEVGIPLAEVGRPSMESEKPLEEGRKSLEEVAGELKEKRTSRCMETPFVVCVLLSTV